MRVFVCASDAESIAAAASDACAIGHEFFQVGSVYVGYIDVPSHSVRGVLRNDDRITILPNRHAQGNDMSKHTKAFPNAKTARDLFTAVFMATGLDLFDPDL